MKIYFLAATIALTITPAFGACTDQQMLDKATMMASKLEALQAKNPKAAEEISTRMMTVQSDPKAATDMNAMCKSYDDALAEISKAK